jgi:lysozyme|tara:strand:- start:14 stop:436 length:423 start_codon:yes stop_codon:yes gene_type:complete
MNLDALEQQLVEHEGLRLDMYKDTMGIATIGVGRNLEHVGLRTEAEARFLLRSDILAILAEMEVALPWLNELDEIRQRVLLDMAFNLGVAGLCKFTATLDHVEARRFDQASVEMLDSRWADQVGQRAVRLSEMMATGEAT